MSADFQDQPIYRDDAGTLRFQENPIVQYILRAGPFDMNAIALLPCIPPWARAQFAQLIGYSLSGYGELSYVSDDLYERADGKRGES